MINQGKARHLARSGYFLGLEPHVSNIQILSAQTMLHAALGRPGTLAIAQTQERMAHLVLRSRRNALRCVRSFLDVLSIERAPNHREVRM